jgi:hypothetical protein
MHQLVKIDLTLRYEISPGLAAACLFSCLPKISQSQRNTKPHRTDMFIKMGLFLYPREKSLDLPAKT